MFAFYIDKHINLLYNGIVEDEEEITWQKLQLIKH